MILGILQARASSKRLPQKVLRPILGVPMVIRQVERIHRAKKLNGLVLATSSDLTDNVVEETCKKNKVECFRGSLDDVLDRFYQATRAKKPDHVVRLTGDCPLVDPELIDQLIEFHLKGNFDYSSNILKPTYPDGLDIEVVRFSCLEEAWHTAKSKLEREHVTPYFYHHPERFSLGDFRDKKDLSQLRWTVDEPEDFELVTRIYESLYPKNPAFTTQDVLDFLASEPGLIQLNSGHMRNAGLKQTIL
ncbi:MAG: hypothetical protein UW91_C0010G0002 [Parcubacteria group bacterium GW2011_GWF2_45_11]|nr:MAG: hypothetical protein UW91_C0010G0002 [Parcubacteria group bacterium GW2011_GWF2_45_11]OGW69901.1 MAG: spore coat protein [Omnitrophica bacterium GWA2_50_21]